MSHVGYPVVRLEEQRFFFEKKKQKTFISCVVAPSNADGGSVRADTPGQSHGVRVKGAL
jgi:hypothetical protein